MSEYHKYVEKDAALERRFQSVYVEEPTTEQAIEILKGIAPKYEEHHKVTITEEAIRAAVLLSQRYINDRNLPDKAIDLIDEAAAAVRLKNMTVPSNLETMAEEIRFMDERLEQCIREEDLEEAARIRKDQDKLIAKYDKAKERNRKSSRRDRSPLEKMRLQRW